MILPKTIDINKAKAEERKNQIDEGLILARRVDELRQMRLDMEKNFETWRIETSKSIQEDIDKLVKEKESLEAEIVQKDKIRRQLIVPLDAEWKIVNQEKEQLVKDKNELFLDKERFNSEVLSLEKQKSKVKKSLENALENEKETEALNAEARENQNLTRQEYKIALEERQNYTQRMDKKLEELNQRKTEFEVATKTFELREQAFKEKESEFNSEKILLKDQIGQLERELKRK